MASALSREATALQKVMPVAFHNLNLRFPDLPSFAAWLRSHPALTWKPAGSTYHNTYRPDEAQWRGHVSMRSMQETYEAKGWDRGPHLYLAAGTAPGTEGIFVMTPPSLPGIHAGACNPTRFGIEVVGDFQNRRMTEAQLALLVGAAAELHRYARIGPDIIAHRDCMPGRTCPGDAAYAQRGTIQRSLLLALSRTPGLAHGVVLTHTRSIASLRTAIAIGSYTALKVVTGWGIPGPWTDADRQLVAPLAPTLIVRTTAGDPSSGHDFLHPEEVIRELTPWLSIKPDAWIELGNEPNSAEVDPWQYRYYLGLAITACRAAFPRARLIAPALLLDRGDPQRWLTLLGDLYRQCDAIGVHLYAFHSLAADDTGQQAQAAKLYSTFTEPLALTEYGINDGAMGKAEKGTAYAQFVSLLPARYQLATAYHIDQAATPGTNDAHYHLTADSHRAYGAAIRSIR